MARSDAASLAATGSLRQRLVTLALEWERTFGVAPSITSTIAELDAALLVGHTEQTYAKSCLTSGRTAVARGCDFVFSEIRYQVKANRPSGNPGSVVTLVANANNYDWDRLIWILYDKSYALLEAWEWDRDHYRHKFD